MKTSTIILKVHLLLLVMTCTAVNFAYCQPDSTGTLKEAEENYKIGIKSYREGNYAQAVLPLRKSSSYYEQHEPEKYHSLLYYIGMSYFKQGNYAKSSLINLMAMDTPDNTAIDTMQVYFKLLEGLNEYAAGRPERAGVLLQPLPAEFASRHDFGSEALSDYYLGKSLWNSNRKAAVEYFKKLITLQDGHDNAHPDTREAYLLLAGYFKEARDESSRALYLNKLNDADVVMQHRYPTLFAKTLKLQDNSEVIAFRDQQKRHSSIMLIIIIILSLTILFSFYHIRYKKPSGKADVDRVTDMTEEAENALLKKLEEFERSKRYLEKDITVSKMATLLNSNSKYTASIICRHRGKRVSEYISDLKIDHIVHLLSNEAKYRNYTYKALCEEVGFGSPQNFSRVFKNRMGIGVGEFIEKLED